MDRPECPVAIRLATAADVPALAALYAAAFRAVGPAHYDAVQVEAWAGFAAESRFRPFVLDPHTFVAHDTDTTTGFAGLKDDGHVTALYVHPHWMRVGIGSALMRAVVGHAERRGLGRLYTEASEFSRPLFARFGFTLDEVETVERRGATFERYRMSRALGLNG